MSTGARILVASALGAAALVGWRIHAANASHARAPSAEPAVASAEATAIDVKSELAAFASELERLRQGDDSVVASATERADRLCRLARRCDVERVLAYYAALPPDARRAGLTADAEVARLWTDVRAARREGAANAEWTERRRAIEERLSEIAARSFDAPDFVPAARALTLLARLSAQLASGIREDDPDEAFDRLASAEADAWRARELFRRAGMRKPELEPLFVLGEIAAERRELETAGALYDECLRLAREVDSDAFEENALASLIELARDAGDLGSVRRLLHELAEIRTPQTSWLLTRNHAELLIGQDLAHEAAAFLRAHPPSDPQDQIDWHGMLGAALVRSGDVEAARVELEAFPPRARDATTALALASLALREDDASRALSILDEQTFESEHATQLARAAWLRGEAYARLGRAQAAIAPLVRALELGCQLQSRSESARDEGFANVLGETVGMHTVALLARAHAQLGEDLRAAQAIEAYQSLSLRGLLFGGDAPERSGITESDVRAWSRTVELGLVTWVVGADFAVVAHVAPDGSAAAAAIEQTRAGVEAAVRRLREAVIGGDDAEVARLAAEIEDTLLPPAVRSSIARCASGDEDRVLLLLHGALESLPVEVLPLFDGRTVPLVLPGLPERDPGSAAESYASWTLLGSPLDAHGVRRLVGAREELERAASVCASARVFADADFTREALVAALRGRDPVHVATHLAFGCGERSWRLANVGFELSGGHCLAAHEILAIRPRLPLALLSACETGGGSFLDAEGLQGVARAFLESGTRNLLATLWPVEDGAARSFALAFHRALRAGESPSRAAARARAELRAAGVPRADWAAFRLLGRD